MSYWIPDPRWEMPELLIPGRKPVGPVEIDWDHWLAKGLVHSVLPSSMHPVDLVSKEMHTVEGTVAEVVEPGIGPCIDVGGGGQDGWYFSDASRLSTVGTTSTISVWATHDSVDAWAFEWCAGSPSTNIEFAMGRSGSGSSAIMWVGDQDFAYSGGSYLESGWHFYTITRNGTAVIFYKDGIEHSSDTGSGSPTANWSAVATFSLMYRDQTTKSEGVDGKMALSMVHDRVLNPAQVLLLYRDPYQFLIPA